MQCDHWPDPSDEPPAGGCLECQREGSPNKPASVTLRDLADDLEFWAHQVRQIGMPGTDEVQKKCVQGLDNLIEVLRGYSAAGFTIEG